MRQALARTDRSRIVLLRRAGSSGETPPLGVAVVQYELSPDSERRAREELEACVRAALDDAVTSRAAVTPA